jgi:hypothetical protein
MIVQEFVCVFALPHDEDHAAGWEVNLASVVLVDF